MNPEAETLELLEWPRLAEQVAAFASTAAGRSRTLALPLAPALAISRDWLAETGELLGLDGVLDGGLSFDGVVDIGPLLLRCAKGGTAAGEPLLELAQTLAAARRLRRQIDDAELRPRTTALVALHEKARYFSA